MLDDWELLMLLLIEALPEDDIDGDSLIDSLTLIDGDILALVLSSSI